jgi:putative membrane protein
MLAATLAFAEGAGHAGWWPVFPLFWILVWGAVIFMVFRFWVPGRRQGHSAQGVLADRYARGEITVDEYHERLGVLKERRR